MTTTCTTDAAGISRAHAEISDQQNTIMVHGYDLRALAGLLEMLTDRGHRCATANKDDESIAYWAQANYIAD